MMGEPRTQGGAHLRRACPGLIYRAPCGAWSNPARKRHVTWFICYLHSPQFPPRREWELTRRSCGGRNCGMQIGKGGLGGKPMLNLQSSEKGFTVASVSRGSQPWGIAGVSFRYMHGSNKETVQKPGRHSPPPCPAKFRILS
jgi:hypothetical protein